MKKTALIIFILACSSTSITSQLPYRSFAQFNGDEEAYLKYNFVERGNLFEGKTLAELLNSNELLPLGYERFLGQSKTDNHTYLIAISLYFSRDYGNDFSPFRDQYLTIFWETPVVFDELKAIEKLFPAKYWTDQHYNYFKDKKIKLVRYR
jgi:hypothetical protein